MTSLLGPSRRPDITLNPRGAITLSARVARALDLSPGDIVEIVNLSPDSSIPPSLALRRKAFSASLVGSHRARCLPVCRQSSKGSWRLWSARMAHAVFSSLGIPPDSSLRFPCGDLAPDNSLPIITRLPL